MKTPQTPKRTYNADGRNAQAALTKSRILDCAKSLFEKEGYEKVTIEAIALASQVSVPSIYAIFKSKGGIVRLLMEEALSPERRQSLLNELAEKQIPEDRLAIASKISRQIYDAEKSMMDIFRGAAVLAPELKKLEEEREQRRYNRLEEGIRNMAEKGLLPSDLTLSKAHDILWAFTGRDMYRLFVIERGWTSDDYERWLSQLLVKTLIGNHKVNV
ncbi:MAG: TetR/AcrR family transcriptional regulator [Alphaproteobacteria bacterium]|nr:TetR/AcrR family transcriptional regulator [Alphaproteobacteria bacterium]